MSWDQAPPSKQELELMQTLPVEGSGWDQAPPNERELAGTTEGKNSKIGSAIRGFNQGATANFADEISAGVETAGRLIGLENLGVGDIADLKVADDGPISWDKIKDVYRSALNKERGIIDKDLKDNPVTSTVANVGGAIASPINKVTKGASLAKAGMIYGGAQGLGASEAQDATGLVQDTVTGAAVGGLVGKGTEKVGGALSKFTSKAGKAASDAAEDLSARAIGAERGTINKLGYDKVKAAGRFALDNKNVSSSAKDMIAKNEALKTKGGEMMGKVYDAVDDSGFRGFKPLEVAAKLDEKVGGFYRSPINKGEAKILEDTLEAITMRGDDAITLREAQALKEEIAKVANFGKSKALEVTDKEKIAREAYKLISNEIDTVAEQGAKSVGVKGLPKALKEGKEIYSKASNADKLLKNKLAREQGNKILGLTDTITGGAAIGYGATTGDWVTAAGIIAAKRGASKYGPATAARTLDSLSKTLRMTPKLQRVIKNNPQALNALITRFETTASKAPRAAEKKRSNTSGDMVAIKGSDKWELKGFEKLVNYDKSGIFENPAIMEKALKSKKGRALLAEASNRRTDKQLDKILAELKKLGGS